jgi:hypothetical protein
VAERIIIADLTRERAQVGLASPDSPGVEVPEEFSLPQRAIIRQETAGLLTLAGDAAAGIQSDANTLVFNRLHRLLARVGDGELRSHLAGALWGALCEELEARGLTDSTGSSAVYAILHHLSPQPLLDDFRAACAGASVPLHGFVHEGAALVLGFIRSAMFPKVFSGDEVRATVCLVVAYAETGVDVVCFDHEVTATTRRELVLRDFFHSNSVSLAKALDGRDWWGAVTHFISVEDVAMSEAEQEQVAATMRIASGVKATKKRFQTARAQRIKIKGAAYVARCCHGRGDPTEEYLISNAYHVGVQINRERFHPVLAMREALLTNQFPHRAAQTFSLRGQSGGQLRVNVCCGYSGRMGEAIILGVMTTGDLTRPAGREFAFTVAFTLDAPGGGQFMLETVDSRQPLGSQNFILPGLVI